MPKMMALKPFNYMRQRIAAGQTFNAANSRDANLFVALGRARMVAVPKPVEPVPEVAPRRRSRKPTPAPEPGVVVELESADQMAQSLSGHFYQTRHLEADAE